MNDIHLIQNLEFQENKFPGIAFSSDGLNSR